MLGRSLFIDAKTNAKLLALAATPMGKELVGDIGASSAINFAKDLQKDDRTFARPRLLSGIFEAVTFVAKYLPSKSFRQALAVVVNKVKRQDATLRPIVVEAVVNQVCSFVNSPGFTVNFKPIETLFNIETR